MQNETNSSFNIKKIVWARRLGLEHTPFLFHLIITSNKQGGNNVFVRKIITV